MAENAGSVVNSGVQTQPLALGGQFELQLADLAVELADLALQLGDPRLLLLEGLDPCGLAPQGLVDRQRGKFPFRGLAQLGEMVEPLLMFLEAGVDGVEPFDGPLGHDLQRPQRRQLVVQRGPLGPAIAECNGQVHHAGHVLGPVGFLLQPRDLRWSWSRSATRWP